MVRFATAKGLPSKTTLLMLPPQYISQMTVGHAVVSRQQFSAHLNFEISLPVPAKERTHTSMFYQQNVSLLKKNTTMEQSRPPAGK